MKNGNHGRAPQTFGLLAAAIEHSQLLRAKQDLVVAGEIQRRLLPPSEIDGPGWRVGARCLPARIVAGDFYDFYDLSDGRLAAVVADVSGKGIPAALLWKPP